jgi:hypothetical protein
MDRLDSGDLRELYALVGEASARINKMYDLGDEMKGFGASAVRRVAKICALKLTKQNKIAILQRLVNLRDDMLIIALEDRGEDERRRILAEVYEEAAKLHQARHDELLDEVERRALLTPFWRALLRGANEVGKAFTAWQGRWSAHIIDRTNPALLEEFGSDEAVVKFIAGARLMDSNPDGTPSDRSYSTLVKEDGEWRSLAYSVAFGDEARAVCAALDRLISEISRYEDEHKEAYIVYFAALKSALGAKTNLIGAWQDAERAWMSVRAPIQVAHPLEYYEDHYKKSVALEWDVRLQNPDSMGADGVRRDILAMYDELFALADEGRAHAAVHEKSVRNARRTQLYISRPFLYYGAEFGGLFSAQVVPNDEIVSHELGKKIFAFADNVMDAARAKPFMKISAQVLGRKFVRKEREVLFRRPEIWHRVYQATTIGHEFGHILWIDDDTERAMNGSGAFKNIEEWKATTGGLVAFFTHADSELLPHVIRDTIKRAVGLIAWMKSGEVEPYYCESLIHLAGLFESGVLGFGETLVIDEGDEATARLIEWYRATYLELATHYLAKRDAKEFLERFVVKEEGGWLPREKSVRRFVEQYWELHRSIGRDVDESDQASNWL